MTPGTGFVQPPHLATWLVSLFTLDEEESIVGDLLEEYSHVALKLGIPSARRWYWRQTVKTIAHLFVAGFQFAPWATAAAVVGGFLGHMFLSGLPNKLLSTLTDRYLGYWQTHFSAYMFWATDGMLIAHLILSIVVGCVVALAAKSREMVATMMLALFFCLLAGIAGVWVMHRQVDIAWILWQCADPFAIVVGGAIVRTGRSADNLPTPSP